MEAIARMSSDKIERVRTYDIAHLREDGKDAIAQIHIMVDQMIEERLTGQLMINFCAGGVTNCTVRQSQKVPIDG